MRRSPSKYDDEYSKFIQRNFGEAGEKYLDKTDEYKQAQQEESDGHGDGQDYEEKSAAGDDDESESESEGAGNSKANDYEVDNDWYYKGKEDYERIKALSERQVAELHKKPGNCKHYEKDGMVCATCEDPDTGDNSESCAYSSQPDDKKVAYLSKKSHNYKKPHPVEVEEPENHDDESEDQEEIAVNPPPTGPKPLKHKSESEDADYGAYKIADTNDDVEDYDEPKFAHIKVEPKVNDFEIIPQSKFESRNLNQAYSDFKTKDWSNCNKLMKGEMTCYYCKDHKNAVQEECMFISASNPKNFKVERHETKNYDNSRKAPTPTKKPYYQSPTERSQSLRVSPIVVPDKRERFARLRVGRPLVPTRPSIKSTAEPLVTPKTSLNPNTHDDYLNTNSKKAIKRTISIRKKVFDNDFYQPAESRAIHFESHVRHFE